MHSEEATAASPSNMVSPLFIHLTKTSRRWFPWCRRVLLLGSASVGVLVSATHAAPPRWINHGLWDTTSFWNGTAGDADNFALWDVPATATAQTSGIITNGVTIQTWLGDSGNGGQGTWGTGTDWSPNNWVAGNIAVFGGTGGTVTVGTQTASGLTFNVGGYTLGSATAGMLTLNTGSIITTTTGLTTFASTLNLAGAAGVTLTKTGSGTLALTTSNGSLGAAANPAVWTVTGGTYNGSTGLFDSILSVGAGNNLGAAPTTATTQLILDAGTLQITGTALAPAIGATRTIQVNAAGGAIVDSTGNPFQGAITDSAGSGSSLYLSNTSGTSAFSGIISGAGSLTWNGAGTLSLTGTNTYMGGTVVNAGTVQVSADSNLGATGTGAAALTLNGGTLTSTSGVSLARPITLGANGGTFSDGSGTTTLSGAISGTGSLTWSGAGTLLLTGANPFTGGINLSAGTLAINTGGNLGAATITPPQITFTGNSTFQLGNNNLLATRGFAINSGVTATFDTGTNTGSGVLGGISGAGALNKIGAGTLTLSGANTYAGGTTLTTGALAFVTDASLGAAGGAVNFNGGTLASSQTAAVTMTRTFATGTIGGTIQLDGKTPTSGNNKLTLGTTGQITGSGPLTVTNNGLLSIGAANTGYSGNWTLNGGVVELTNNQGGGTGSFTVNSGAELSTLGSQISNALTLNGGTVSWDYYSGSGNYQGPVTLLGGGGTVSLISFYAGTSGNGNAISGTIGGNISGNGGLTVTDANPSGYTSINGTLTLSGNNSYTGGTTIGLNTTVLLGSITALGATTSPLSVTGFLALNGYSPAVGALTLTGTTTTAPISSASAGTPGAATLAYTFGASSVETLSVASAASLTGTNDLQFNPAALATPGTYTLVTSRNGTLGGAWEFAGEENMTASANSLIVKSNTGSQYSPSSYYRLTLGSSAGSEQVTVSTDVPNKVVTIFPFGSSITAGQSAQTPYNGGGYRSQLYLDLVNDGRFIPNFVGSSTATLANNLNEGNLLTDANQLANEGHPGWTTLQMLANLNMSNGDPGANGGYWLKPGNGENPNYITVNIGGNDAVDYGQDAATMAAASQRLDAIISEFNLLRPGVATVLSTIAYRGDTNSSGVSYSTAGIDPYYNPAMPGVVFNHVLAGQNVSFLDLRSIINYTADTGPDHVHPIQSGYDKMANAWYQSIIYGQAYWTGSQGTVWNTVNGASTNFDLDAALTTDRSRGLNDSTANQYLIYPDVYFSSNTSALNTTLGADTTIRSLNFTSGATGPVSIGAGNTLTIGSVDTGVDSNTPFTLQNSGGITVQAGTGAHTVAANIALGADQTWGNVSSNNLTVTGGISGAHNLALVGSYTVYNPGAYTPNGTNYQGATFTTTPTTVSGTGGFVLSGASTYTGTTTITGTTLTVDNAGSTTPRLANTSAIVLNTGGTLLLASSSGSSTDRINNNAAITLAGGTLNTGGLSEGAVLGTTPTQGLGALTLTANSILDLGAGASKITFANSRANPWSAGTTLSIYDWTGNTAGGGQDAVFFGNDSSGLTSGQLGQITFYSDSGSTLLGRGQILSDGEVVPVPEPVTVLGGFLLFGIAVYRVTRKSHLPA